MRIDQTGGHKYNDRRVVALVPRKVRAVYESIAPKLQLTPQELERESLLLFLNHRLRLIESQLFNLARKYGVQTVAELDERIQGGEFHEAEAFEDYFEFDHLEAERDTLRASLKELT